MSSSASASEAPMGAGANSTDLGPDNGNNATHSTGASESGSAGAPPLTVHAIASWTLKAGMREFLSELVPALLSLGLSDLANLTHADAEKIEAKLSKRAFNALCKKCKAGAGPGGAHGEGKKKKRKPAEPPVVPEPIQLQPADLDAVVFINRAPVLQLWSTCVLKVSGYSDVEALALAANFVRDMSERKRKYLGLYVEKPEEEAARAAEPKTNHVVMGYDVGVPLNRDDLESLAEKSLKYVKSAYGEDFLRFLSAMNQRAQQIGKDALQAGQGYEEYERFRPPVTGGTKGYGEKSRFKLSAILG